jgi:hypothetical protein
MQQIPHPFEDNPTTVTRDVRLPEIIVRVGSNSSRRGFSRQVFLLDPSTSTAAEPGYYIEDGRVVEDFVEDFLCFYRPIRRALIARLPAESGEGER